MSDNLVPADSEEFPALQARRAEIAKRIPMTTPPDRTPMPDTASAPAPSRIDDGPCTDTLAAKRIKAEDEARAGLLQLVPPGAVVRTDEGNGEEPHPTEEVRLKFAEALLSKAEGASPETAALIANAAQGMLGPMIRTDDDANLKNTVTGQGNTKKGSSPGAATAADEEGEEKPRKAPADGDKGKHDDDELPAWAKKLIAEVATIKADKKDDDDEEEDDDDPEPRDPEDGAPTALAADSEKEERRRNVRVRTRKDKEGRMAFDSGTDHLFFPYQARADKAYAMLGMAAPKPMYGETRDNYRRRLLHPLKIHSPEFRHSDLRVVQVDPVAFDVVEKNIYEHAVDAAKNPMTVPLGHLREIKETRGGHEYIKFVGRPISWMAAFAPPGKRIRRIIERSDGGPGRTLFERP